MVEIVNIVNTFFNLMMRSGNRAYQQKVYNDVLLLLRKETGENGNLIIAFAVQQLQPVIEAKTLRLKGAATTVPVPINSKRQVYLACKWIIADIKANRVRNNEIEKPNQDSIASKRLEYLQTKEPFSWMGKRKRFVIRPIQPLAYSIVGSILSVYNNQSQLFKNRLALMKTAEKNRS